MKALCDKLNTTKSIKRITAKDLKSAVKKAYSSNLFNFYLNSELIDVNNRFRVFEYDQTFWLAKKSKKHKAILEQEFAKKAKAKLNGKIVNNRVVRVLDPIFFDMGEQGYLLTKYNGQSLQETLYSGANKSFTLNDLKELLRLIDENNMVFRGLLPRNIILSENEIYLIDWEDVVFYELHTSAYLNLQFKTNFLLNWGYFFKQNDLEQLINDINENKVVKEPELNKYELIFNSFNKEVKDLSVLREKILNVVLFAEKNIVDNTNEFIIKPNDMAHLVSDIFTNEIDVLFDLCCFALRQESEEMYCKLLLALSNQIANQYETKYINQPSLFIYILLMLDLDVLKNVHNNFNNIEELTNIICKFKTKSICYKYLFEDISLYKEEIKNNIIKVAKDVDNSFCCDDDFCEKVYNYMIYLQKQRNCFNSIFETKYFILIQKTKYPLFPRFYTLKLKDKFSINQREVVKELTKLQKVIREVYESYGIKQVGIYAENDSKCFFVNFVPYYQTRLKKLGIDPDFYQPHLESYLNNYIVEPKTICCINEDMKKRIIKRIKKYE